MAGQLLLSDEARLSILRMEYDRLVEYMKGPRDNGHFSTQVESFEDYAESQKGREAAVLLREKLRAERRAKLREFC